MNGSVIQENREAVEQNREQESKTVEAMNQIYCHGIHGTRRGNLCEQCGRLLEYASVRTEKCPFMETKTFCSACKVHCYSGEMQDQMKVVMRYAGPRMLFVQPRLALRHLAVTRKQKREAKRGKL